LSLQLGSHVTDAISWSFADYKDEHALTAAFVGADRLILVPPSTQDRDELTCQGLQAAGVAGVKHIVLMSAVVAQFPNTMFGGQFRRIESFLESMRPSLNFTILRMAWFMENFIDMAPDLVANNRFLSSWGSSGIAPVAMADIGRSAAAVLSTPKTSMIHYNRTFHLTGPEAVSGARMAEVFTKVFKRQISYQDLPREDMKKVYVEGMKVPEWQAEGYVEMNDLFKAGGASAFSTDVAMLTGVHQTTLERFLQSKRWYFTGHRSPLTVLMPASGRVGTSTLMALMNDPAHGRVRAVVHTAAAQNEITNMFANATNLEVVHGDFEDEASVRAAFDGADSIMIIPPERLERFSALDHAITLASELGATHTVLFSVSQGLDQTAIGRKFNAWERVLEHHSESFTIIHCTFFHDLMFYFADQIKHDDHQVHHWLGNGKFCPVDARDVGEAAAAVLREGPLVHHCKSYSLYGPQALSFQDMLDKLGIVLGYKVYAQPDITSEQVRNTMDGKLPSFNIEEVVQAQEVVGMGGDARMTPDLLKLVGHAHTVQSFCEDNKHVFMSAGSPPSQRVVSAKASPMVMVTAAVSPQRMSTTSATPSQMVESSSSQQNSSSQMTTETVPSETTSVTTTIEETFNAAPARSATPTTDATTTEMSSTPTTNPNAVPMSNLSVMSPMTGGTTTQPMTYATAIMHEMNKIPETSINQESAQMSKYAAVEIKPGAAAIPVAATQPPAVAES
jgi:uncharacterized protein YbjT (DUF2867 family)